MIFKLRISYYYPFFYSLFHFLAKLFAHVYIDSGHSRSDGVWRNQFYFKTYVAFNYYFMCILGLFFTRTQHTVSNIEELKFVGVLYSYIMCTYPNNALCNGYYGYMTTLRIYEWIFSCALSVQQLYTT